MMNQEDYVKVADLHRQGWTKKEIAAELGYHPATIAKWLRSDGPPIRREVPDDVRVMSARWRERVAGLLEAYPRLLAVSVFNKIRAEGFAGSYPTVVREVRAIRGPRFRAAGAVSVPIHTDPGEEAQFDFCELDDWAERWGWETPLVCFGAILSWSRQRIWWFTTSQDRHHTFEGLARFFETVGGVPGSCRTDRMGALGTAQGRRFRLHPPAVGFAAHYGTKITTCRARDAKRKGKVERPFRQLQETFLPEVEADGIPAGVDELNARATAWLDERVHAVVSRSTGEPPVARLEAERTFLTPLPRQRFDTDYVECRRVHTSFPFIVLDGVRYSVPPQVLGQLVEVRRPVDACRFEIRWAGQTVASHTVAPPGAGEVWDAQHRQAAEADAVDRRPRRHLRAVLEPEPTPPPPRRERLDLGPGDFDVEVPDLATRYGLEHKEAGA
jgi:transposase